MPIYDYEGHKRTTKDVDYLDDEKRFAVVTRVVHFGSGDIQIGIVKSRNDFEDEIAFVHAANPQPVGARDDSKWVSDAPVRLLFDKSESIDSLIDCLTELKTKMPEEN